MADGAGSWPHEIEWFIVQWLVNTVFSFTTLNELVYKSKTNTIKTQEILPKIKKLFIQQNKGIVVK